MNKICVLFLKNKPWFVHEVDNATIQQNSPEIGFCNQRQITLELCNKLRTCWKIQQVFVGWLLQNIADLLEDYCCKTRQNFLAQIKYSSCRFSATQALLSRPCGISIQISLGTVWVHYPLIIRGCVHRSAVFPVKTYYPNKPTDFSDLFVCIQ